MVREKTDMRILSKLEWKNVFMKNNIPVNKKSFGFKVKKNITLLNSEVSHKNKRNDPRRKFVIGSKTSRITQASKHFRMRNIRFLFIEDSKRCLLT